MYSPNSILKVIQKYDTLDQVRIINQLYREGKISSTTQEQLLKALVKPCSIFRVGDTVKHRDRLQKILHQYTGTVVSIEPTVHGCDYIGVEINNEVRFFMSTDLTH